MSKSDDITKYVNSAISAETVALGGGIPNINTKAVNCGIAIGLSSYANNNIHGSGHGVAIGCETSAVNYGVAIGEKAKSDEALAIGPDAFAMHNALALGRYAKATGNYAVQLNGAEDSATNTDDYTFKYYYGKSGSEKNITIVNADGKISADAAVSAETALSADEARSLSEGASLGTTIKIGDNVYTIGTATVKDVDGKSCIVLSLSQQATFEINNIVDTTKTVTTAYGTNQPNRIATDGVNTIVVPCVVTANGTCCFQVSEDGGQTFTALTELFPPATSDVRFAYYDQLTNSFIVVSSGSDYNIYRLKKETSGWTKTTLMTGTNSFYGVSVCGSKILAVGKSKQIYLSEDSGITWTNIYNATLDAEFTNFYGCCITDNILIVTIKGKSSSQKAIYWSEDNGTTWHASAMYEKNGTTLCTGYSSSSGVRNVEKVGNKFVLSFMDMYNPNSTATDYEKNIVPFISDDGKSWKKANIDLKFVWSEDAKQYVPTKYTCPMQCVKIGSKNIYVQLDSGDMNTSVPSTDGFAGYFYVSQDECETFESKEWKDLNRNHATVLRPRSCAVIGTKLVGFDNTDSFSDTFKVFDIIKQ